METTGSPQSVFLDWCSNVLCFFIMMKLCSASSLQFLHYIFTDFLNLLTYFANDIVSFILHPVQLE